MNAHPSFAATLLATLRVYQWPKNLLVFAALLFAQQMFHAHMVLESLGAFVALCAASSAVYIFNDLKDMESDRAHPEKRNRPLASGEIGTGAAVVLMLVLLVCSVLGSYLLRPAFCGAVVFYLLLMLTYTIALKKIMFVDVLVIAIGFVFRAIAGAIVLDVAFSNWLAVCTLFLALFLGLGKRRCEIEVLEAEAAAHRDVLREYTVHHLDSLLTIMAACTLLTYTIYTCSPEVVHRLGTDKLYVTLPFVVYGLFRYLHLIHHKNGGGDPSRTLLKDGPLALTVALWGVACTVIIYGGMWRYE
ncbi:MAG: decaprenyl-phosphate phosphoribosyltransferase [Candidatus Hydrogenedentes bacterium]|nr:decaprenyl-phosphate phosphoribosyltransferase [Candidatus Hydrogenedentota bacterium]